MTYNPARISDIAGVEELRRYVEEELEKISKEFNETIALDLRTVHQEPKRPREGMIVSADGSDWNPGAGGGAYEFVGGVWRRVSGIVDGDYGDIVVSGGVWSIEANAVSLAKMAQIATARLLGRVTASTGNVEALTGTQATTLLDVFTNLLKGLVPASGGGTTNFLRADGQFAVPPGTGGGATLAVDNQAHGGGATMTLTGWAASTKILIILLTGLSHNSGANQNLRVALSGDGSSYGTANIITGAAVSSVTPVYGLVIIGRIDKTSNFPIVTGTLGGIGALEAGVTGPVTHAQLSFAGGSFDAGSASVYALF